MSASRLARHLGAAALVLAPAPLACTSILGIDGEYVSEVSGSPHGKGGGGSAGGSSGAGDSSASVGGTSGTGGDGAGGGAGAGVLDAGRAGSGGAVTRTDASPVSPDCNPGAYSGKFDGEHAPSFTVVAFPVPITGTVSFRLEAAGPNQLRMAGAKLEGHVTLATGLSAFSGTEQGDIDCVSHQLTAGTLTGTMTPGVPVSGTVDGTLLGSKISGTWSEQEPNPQFSGHGTWSATRTGP